MVKEDGILFSIDERYNVNIEKVSDFDPAMLASTDHFMPFKEALDGGSAHIRDGEYIVIAKMRRKKIIQDLSRLGYEVGCPVPENAYYLVAGQPNAQDFPPTIFYEIRHTFEDMGWEYTGCPHRNHCDC